MRDNPVEPIPDLAVTPLLAWGWRHRRAGDGPPPLLQGWPQRGPPGHPCPAGAGAGSVYPITGRNGRAALSP
ncbi:hypothetical protein [Calidithermus terrae]|uniref:hypothetical protein n=1 Tax=Calidithermus terrae TaxID=1408545 RepID=UPI0011C491F1|nr:hypothetical protein [Calidithermus terrae]